ncbi:hypothetical protein IPN35_01770 [Candidatus Peregrinibacteria bacterium]|nr:MAG: hypothetical protein IPN35_01770 [Candidatus Peregrinibacteria bacterium]
MKQSFLAFRTDKDTPHDADSANAKLLTQGGFIQKEMSGVYSFLPLGLRSLSKIEGIIREEMNTVGAQEVRMPALTPRQNWEQTGRSNVDIAYTPTENTVLGWSHEEIVTPMAKALFRSYRDFPKCLYQVQTKFRNEPRAKSGLLRGREFLMKDAYSFHTSPEDFQKYYEEMAKAYFRIYERCGLKAYKIESGGGEFSKNISHEFSVISPAGEDVMIFCECGFAKNKEIISESAKQKVCPDCQKELQESPCIEVGNIFDLGTKYSDAFKFHFSNTDGIQKHVHMGCYGIGVSRLLGTIAEIHHDETGIKFPKNIAPFQVHILSLREDQKADEIRQELEEDGFEVLCDDRDESPGKKFADADLIGIPIRIVISKRTLAENSAEVKYRATGETHYIPLIEIPRFVWEFYTDSSPT